MTAGMALTPIPVMMAIVVRQETCALVAWVEAHVLGTRLCVTTTTIVPLIIVSEESANMSLKTSFSSSRVKTEMHAP